MTLPHHPLWPVADPRARIEQVQRETATDFEIRRLPLLGDDFTESPQNGELKTATTFFKGSSLSPSAWQILIGGIAIASWVAVVWTAYDEGHRYGVASRAAQTAPTQTAGRAQ